MAFTDKALIKDVHELSLDLENRTFVDYFNTFLCLPVFGQHVFYNFMEIEFDFEPPIKQRRHLYLDRREVLFWLAKERLGLFRMSSLYTEYNLCMKLRETDIELPGMKESDPDGVDRRTFIRNIIGTVTGMLLFRESLRGSNGERVYRCWKDLEAWKLIQDPVRKMHWKRIIKTKYINQNSASEVRGTVRLLVFQGNLNFKLFLDDELDDIQTDNLLGNTEVQSSSTDEALLQMQAILLKALKKYWLPRHLIHILQTTPEEKLNILKRPAPGDLEYSDHERRLRCRFMFPTIYQESNISSPTTSIFVSKSAGELPKQPSPLIQEPTPDVEKTEEEEDEDEDDIESAIQVEPVDLLSIWGGPAREIEITSSKSSSTITSFPEEHESPDEFGQRKLRSTMISEAQSLKSPVPIELTSFLGGKRRMMVGRFPKTTSRIVWSLASDFLASCPFRTFLQDHEFNVDLQYLSFWTDVRNYLDVDENAVDSFGQPLRRLLAHGILQKYLSHDGEGSEIFSETLKISLYRAIVSSNDVSLLCTAQDIVQKSLWESLKQYIRDERKRFLSQVRGNRYNLTFKKRRKMDDLLRKSKSNMAANELEDPLFFFNCAEVETESQSSISPATFSPTLPRSSAMSRPITSYHVTISEEQMWKATELAVLCCEYGSPMMVPQQPPQIQHLVDILHSDFGSLHVSRVPSVRNEWLRNLIHPAKINIETVRVSRKVYLEKVDLASTKEAKETEKEPVERPRNRLVVRRNGMILDRPTKPKTFIEVLTIPAHFDFFKRFMVVNKIGLPLLFWKAVEDLKDLSNSKTRQIRVTQIMRKFFGRYSKFGAMLDCNEEIIRQIPNMEKVTPGILICAQAAVYRSMERKWYPLYLESYPPESETSSRTNITGSLLPMSVKPDFMDVVNKARKGKKKQSGLASKIIRLWKNIARSLLEFHRSLVNKPEVQLLEIFLKCEIEKEQYAALTKDTGSIHPLEKNLLMSNLAANTQTRVVIRNRLVILNRLPADLKFWIEVLKYQDLVDGATAKGILSAQDTEFLCDKARSVISCYLASEVPPKVQINIPNDLATNIINGLAASGPLRGLFHDAIFLLFPLLYHFYRKFQDEVINGDIPDEYLETIENTFKDRVSSNPHPEKSAPDFRNVNEDDIKTTHQTNMDENIMRIHFSLTDGIVFIYPVSKVPKTPTQGGRRMTKQSIHALSEEPSSKKESRHHHHPVEKKDGRNLPKNGDRQHSGEGSKHPKPVPPTKEKENPKKTERIIVREAQDSRRLSLDINYQETSNRARRLSSLVESLNKEKQRKLEEQSRKCSKPMTFNEVVGAAMTELSDSNSTYFS